MILFIITLAVLIIGILLGCHSKNDIMNGIGLLLFACGALAGVIMLVIIVLAHVGVDAQIEENRIEYEALCERQEVVMSEYEDVSKSDIIKDIAEWNKKVYSSKHWAYNPWTNWFYSKRVVDELEMIEREGGDRMKLPDSCADCEFLRNGFTEEAPMWECGLESDEMTSVLVDDNGKPFDFRPMWCRYDKEVDV